MLSMLYVRLTITVKVGIPESFKVGWYSREITAVSVKMVGTLWGLLVPSMLVYKIW